MDANLTASSESTSNSEVVQEVVEETIPTYVARKAAIYVTTREEFDNGWNKFFVEGMDFAGIDCEFFEMGEERRKKLALLQLTGPRCTLLYHITRMSSKAYCTEPDVYDHTLPAELVKWLEDDSVQKSGVNSTSDACVLSRSFGVTVRSIVELELLARRLYDPVSTKLEVLSELVLEEMLPKKKNVTDSWQQSNWKDELTEERKTYAVNNSDCSYELYAEMRKHAKFPDCPRGVYLKDVESGMTKVGRNVPVEETPEYEKRMKRQQQKKAKKKGRRGEM